MLGRTLRLHGFSVLRVALVLGVCLAANALWACDQGGEKKPPSVDGGVGGEGGCPVRPPEPLFVLNIQAEEGQDIPSDTSVFVKWSAGSEPPFVLSDPATWKTLDESNLVCNVQKGAPPPKDLLKCDLWANGAVNVLVEATGYEPHEDTLSVQMSELCGGPMPMTVAVVLMRAKMDGGAPP